MPYKIKFCPHCRGNQKEYPPLRQYKPGEGVYAICSYCYTPYTLVDEGWRWCDVAPHKCKPFMYLCDSVWKVKYNRVQFKECFKCHLHDKRYPYVYIDCEHAKPVCYKHAVMMKYKDRFGRVSRPWWQSKADQRALTEQCPACGEFEMQVDHKRRMKRCQTCGKVEPIWGYEGDQKGGFQSIKESFVRKYRVT